MLRATVRSEVAKKEFLHDALMMTCRETMLVAAKLGRTERALKRKCKTAHENERAATRTKSILGSRVKKLNAKLFAQRKESISLQKAVLDEQAARKLEAEKAAFAAEEVKSTKARIKRPEKNLAAEKLRVEKAEEACREKDDAIKAAEQRQEESDSELATALNNLEEATEHIGELQQEHELLQEKLRVAESTARDLQQKLKTAEKAIHTLQVKVGTLETQLDEKSEQLQAKFAAGLQDIEARMMKRFNALEDKSYVTEQRCKDLVEQLATTQEAQADVAKDLEASRKTEKVALERVQRIEHEHQQQVNNIKAAEKAQRDDLSKKNARKQKKLQEELTEAREHNKMSKQQHKSDLEAVQRDLTAAESQKQALEAKLEKKSGFEKEYSKAVADAIPLGKEFAAATQKIQTQTNKCLTLSGLNDVAKERCAELGRDNEAIQASLKQQQDANSNLVAAQKAQLSRETQHANKLQKEVDGLCAEMQNMDNELCEARVDKANLTEKFNKDAEIAAANSGKVLQEEQSKNKIQQDQTESLTQDLKDELLVCQRELVLTTQNYDVLREVTEKERRDDCEWIQEAIDSAKRAGVVLKERRKDPRAIFATAGSLKAEGLDDEDDNIDDSSLAKQQSTKRSKRAGKDRKQRRYAVQLQLERNAAVEALSYRTHGQNNQQHQAPQPAQFIPQQQAPPQFISQQQTEFIPQQQSPAHSLQPNQLLGTANSFNPAPMAFQPPPQQIHALRGSQHQALDRLSQPLQRLFQGLSASHHGPGHLLQPLQQRTQGLGDSNWA